MVNNSKGGKKSIETQRKKYPDLSAEMARRARMRKTIGKGGFYDPEVARRAALKSAEVRRKDEKDSTKNQNQPQE